jgi:hypothetical protein
MTFYQALSLALGAVVAVLAIDRVYFQRTCKLRHNPIDEAIHRIEAQLTKFYAEFVKHITDGGKK